MYTDFYGLREKPFALSPDPRYLFLAEAHREALAHLLYGIDQGEGFIAITGEVGTGKTTLCRTLVQRVGEGTEVAFIFNPVLSPRDLLAAIHAELGLDAEERSQHQLGESLNRFLLEKHRERRRVLLLVDEAQNLEDETLEQLRLLSNLETERAKLLQIVLLGQPELEAKLDSPELRQLRQRISVHWRLAPLSAAETCAYVEHRLRIAAGAERPLFTRRALREVHRRTRGIPRLVNILCDRALLAAYAEGSHEIAVKHVRQANREQRPPHRRPWRWLGATRRRRWAVTAPLLLALGLTGGIALGKRVGSDWVEAAALRAGSLRAALSNAGSAGAETGDIAAGAPAGRADAAASESDGASGAGGSEAMGSTEPEAGPKGPARAAADEKEDAPAPDEAEPPAAGGTREAAPASGDGAPADPEPPRSAEVEPAEGGGVG